MADRHDAGTGVSAAAAGRPRDSRIAEEVLAATRASLIELGWERTSIRGVAERSGVSRPAIARRWPSKAHLVLEAILGAAPDLDAFDGVDTAGWISGVIAGSFDIFDRPEVRAAAPGLMATLRDHPDIREALWLGFSGPASALVDPLPPRPSTAPAGRRHSVRPRTASWTRRPRSCSQPAPPSSSASSSATTTGCATA